MGGPTRLPGSPIVTQLIKWLETTCSSGLWLISHLGLEGAMGSWPGSCFFSESFPGGYLTGKVG